MALGFVPSDAALLAAQSALVAAPAAGLPRWLRVGRGRLWALIPAASVVAVVAGLRAAPGGAQGLTWLALVACPPLAGVAAAWAARGARPLLALLAPVLLVLAWIDRGGLTGQACALALSAGACVTLARLLTGVAPLGWLKAGIVLMAVLDALLVGVDLLQRPAAVLNAAAPAAGLPRLQFAAFGTASMGFGDLFIAALLGAVLAAQGLRPGRVALAVLVASAAFDVLFLVLDELPATVPVALVLVGLELARFARHDSRAQPSGR